MANTINLNRKNTYITIWLYLSLFLVFLLIFIGGLTRLTESGLSITSWELFSGILPPLNEKQWQNYFSLYKQIPQYKEINLGMSMADFKYIPSLKLGTKKTSISLFTNFSKSPVSS